MTFSFTIPCRPTTKKNSGQIVMIGKFPRIFPSKQFRVWDKAAQRCLVLVRRQLPASINEPMNCAALFFRETAIGDAVGYYQALADTLETAGIVTNDRLIVSWDGSRLLKDKHSPRVEVTLTTLVDLP